MPRFRPAPRSSSTLPVSLRLDVPPADWQAELEEARQHTMLAIDYYRQIRGTVSGRKQRTLDKNEDYLGRLFNEPLILDPVLGQLRPPTLPELLRPDSGKRLAMHVFTSLEELHDQVAIDICESLRAFANFVCKEGGAQVTDSINLRERWGPLWPPFADRELQRRTPKKDVYLPRIEQMDSIYEAIVDWALIQRKQWWAMRTATITTVCFASGLRGIEGRWLCFEDQLFDRSLGLDALLNPLNVDTAKTRGARRAHVQTQGWRLLRYWLAEWRDLYAPEPLAGRFFPSSNDGHDLSSASLSETSRKLLDHLKAKGLLHDTFTFHATRKTYATHFIERNGTDVNGLLDQCGWASPVQLGTYVKPSVEAVERDRDRFARMVGARNTG